MTCTVVRIHTSRRRLPYSCTRVIIIHIRVYLRLYFTGVRRDGTSTPRRTDSLPIPRRLARQRRRAIEHMVHFCARLHLPCPDRLVERRRANEHTTHIGQVTWSTFHAPIGWLNVGMSANINGYGRAIRMDRDTSKSQ